MMKKFLYTATAILGIIACTDNNPVTPQGQDDTISLTPKTVEFLQDGGEEPVMVNSSGEWTLKADQTYDWISTDIEKGKDGDVVTFTAKPNFSGKELSANYTFTCGKASAKFTAISHSGEVRFLNLSTPAEVELAHNANRLEVILSTNIMKDNFKISVVSSAADFCTFKLPKEGDNAVTMVFDLKNNDSRESRTADITIEVDSSKEPGTENIAPVKVKLTQRAQSIILTDQSEYSILPEGGKIEMAVDANVEYTVAVNGSWLKHEGKVGNKETFSAGALTGSSNTATVTFTEKSPLEGTTPAVTTVTVNQKSTSSIISKAIRMTSSRAWPEWSTKVFSQLNNMDKFTFEILFKADDFGQFGKVSTLFGIHEHFLFHLGDSNLESNKLRISSRWRQKTDDPKLSFSANKWHHFAFTFDKGYIKFYIDGQLILEKDHQDYLGITIPFNIPHNQTEANGQRCFWVGYSYEPNRNFNGLMSEFRFWNKVLTAQEIQATNHFYTVDSASEGLLGYWKFAESQIIDGRCIIPDETGNGSPMVFEQYKNGSWSNSEAAVTENVSLP